MKQESKKFSNEKIADMYRQVKASDFFYDTNPSKAAEYLGFLNDIKNYEEDLEETSKKCGDLAESINKKFIGFFRSSNQTDCITLSVVDTQTQEISHCSYQFLDDGKLVNLKNLRVERENATKYDSLEEFVRERSKNLHILTRDEIKTIQKNSKQTNQKNNSKFLF